MGYTVVWDLRGKREVVALAYGGGAGTMSGPGGGGSGMAVGGRRGMSAIAWHPDNVCILRFSFGIVSLYWFIRQQDWLLLQKTIRPPSSWSGISGMHVRRKRYGLFRYRP
jgi:hypothetical protein